VVAGNRDEFLTRSALAPHVWTVQTEGPEVRIFAGKDQKEGGTWFGINEEGLVVGVTNRYTGTRDADKLSRGQLVLKCLAAGSVQAARSILTPDEVLQYNPFNLFCLSEEAGLIVTHDTEGFQGLSLDPGIHVLTNRPPDDPQDGKREWLASRLGNLPPDPEAIVDPVSQALAYHGEGDDNASICVHLPGYGTVSSSVLFLANQRERSRYLYADGPPCQAPFRDLTPDLMPLFL
jgi:hypothetical protein